MARHFLQSGENIMGRMIYVLLKDEADPVQAIVTEYDGTLSDSYDYTGIITCQRIDRAQDTIITNVRHVSRTGELPFWYYHPIDIYYSMMERLNS